MGFDKNKFWYYNVMVLFENITETWPDESLSFPEKLNSLARLVMINGIIMSIFYKDYRYISVSLFLLLVFGLYLRYNHSQYENIKEKIENEFKSHHNPYLMNGDFECRESTPTNPFANPLYGTSFDPTLSACPYDSNKEIVNHNFDSNLYKSHWDIYNKNNSQRQFYSLPSTSIPNDQIAYANWLYGKSDTCKSNYKTCTGFENGGAGGN